MASRRVAEADIWLYAGLSGDYYGVHTNREFARLSPFGEPIAHGAFVLALAVAGAARRAEEQTGWPVRLRHCAVTFRAPVRTGDRLAVEATAEGSSDGWWVRLLNQRGDVVMEGSLRLEPRGEAGDVPVCS